MAPYQAGRPACLAGATVLVGEAMLSMQTAATKQAILREAHRLLVPGGRYVIHELAVTPDSLDPAEVARIQADLSAVGFIALRTQAAPASDEAPPPAS